MHQPGPHKSVLTHPKYRPDIDGLRAFAVLCVVAYHATPFWVRGGFVGVDIFFVISGFLISTILFENLRRGSFDYRTFYGRRIRRIFPALILVLMASFATGWFLLPAGEYAELGKHIAGGAGFAANFVLWNESGYFDSDAAMKPLLHLWSLGIEEQFYIVWPLALWLAWKKNLNWLTITGAVVLASFLLNLATGQSDAVADFYSPLTRFWELLVGAVIANPRLRTSPSLAAFRDRLDGRLTPILYETPSGSPGRALGNVASVFGAGLILFALARVTAANTYPSGWAILPTLGTAAIILAGRDAWLNRKLLAHPLAVWFGLISYPLYLWHWPLLSFARITQWIDPDAPSRGVRFGAVAMAILLAWLTYRFVETPMRSGSRLGLKTGVLVLLMALIGGLGVTAILSGGLPNRAMARAAADLSNYDYYQGTTITQFWRKSNPCFLLEKDGTDLLARNGCERTPFPGRPKVFLVGDSHGGYLSLGLKPTVLGRHLNFYQYTANFCVPFIADDARRRCNAINDYALKAVAREKPDVLFIFAHYMSYQTDPENLGKTAFNRVVLARAQAFKDAGAKKIVILGQMPTWQDGLPNVLLRRFIFRHRPIPVRTYDGVTQQSLMWDRIMREQIYPDDIVYVSLKDFLCNASGCLTQVGPDIKKDLVVQDYGHLTKAGAGFISGGLLSRFLPN